MERRISKEECNLEPVFYCANCLSLNIKMINGEGTEYCDSCSLTDIRTTTIEEWERMYQEKYGKKYLD